MSNPYQTWSASYLVLLSYTLVLSYRTVSTVSVETSMCVRRATLISSELYKWYPGASEVLLVGAFPFGGSN